jgi:hypothetical protein
MDSNVVHVGCHAPGRRVGTYASALYTVDVQRSQRRRPTRMGTYAHDPLMGDQLGGDQLGCEQLGWDQPKACVQSLLDDIMVTMSGDNSVMMFLILCPHRTATPEQEEAFMEKVAS